jgi:hypothetical protein
VEELVELVLRHEELSNIYFDVNTEAYKKSASRKDMLKIEDEMYKIAKKLKKEADNDRK